MMMLKEGKTEISFSVPSASVVFVDIVHNAIKMLIYIYYDVKIVFD